MISNQASEDAPRSARWLLLLMIGGLAACTSTEQVAPEERQAVAVNKALYDAIQAAPTEVFDPSIPLPDDFLPPSTSYEDCAHHVIPFSDLDEVLMLKALQVCERRHLDEDGWRIAVDELMRYALPVHMTKPRFVIQDTDVTGLSLKRRR